MRLLVNLVLGHKATVLETPTPNGSTHDWEIYVGSGSDANLGEYIDRVSFKLHDNYENPLRTVVSPPFRIRDVGYAGFIVKIKIYFKGDGDIQPEPEFTYDLFLQAGGEPLSHSRRENLTITTSDVEFERMLLHGGAIILGSGISDSQLTDPMDGGPGLGSLNGGRRDTSQFLAKKRKLDLDKEAEDEFDTFGKLVAHKLRYISGLDRLKGTRLQAKVQKILLEGEIDVLEESRNYR
ncbi:protein AF-9 [Folsomia candida]|uniref:Protein ENL n=1 Tax=Folsomia candida TaxID=158441 RepID=A0A226E9Z3_FOLCA|nr:protein AF-9 [Folsomia candida]OXA54269.1 Protein ENL [Folsomia candida]